MRPVNLIPPEQRRGSQAQLRSGPLAYMLVGALVLGLIGVVALVLTSNQISDRKDELAQVKVEDAKAAAKAKRLKPYTQFQELREQRVTTLTSLADSRFDWERVMREFALVLPHDAWLVSLKATATPGVNVEATEGESGSELSLRESVPGPALELTGCASGQEAVADFVTALKDIDGVTRVGVASSALPDEKEGAGSVAGHTGGGGSEDCRTRKFIAKFEIVVAFDAAPIPIAGSAEGEVPAPVATPPPEESQNTSSESSEGG
jgi:Tfp pilus assembly protein PilN